MENVLGKVDNQDENTETMLISSIDEGTVEVMDQSNKTNEVTKSKRKRGIGCDECDIPCNTKKELKVNLKQKNAHKTCVNKSPIYLIINLLSINNLNLN